MQAWCLVVLGWGVYSRYRSGQSLPVSSGATWILCFEMGKNKSRFFLEMPLCSEEELRL